MQPRPRTPSESARAVRVMPGVSIGTRNAVTPWPRSPGRVRREHDRDRRFLGVRDPHLAPGDAIAGAGFDRRGLLIRGVGAGVGLRQRKGADRLAARKPAQPLLALLIAARVRNELGDERVGHRQRHGDRRARLRDRLDGERVAHVVAPGAAPRLRNRDAEQPMAGRGAHHVVGNSPDSSMAAARGATTSRANCSLDCLKGFCSCQLEHHDRWPLPSARVTLERGLLRLRQSSPCQTSDGKPFEDWPQLASPTR